MSDTDAAFYFDLASPLAYLAAERVRHTLPIACEWQPILAHRLTGAGAFQTRRGHAEVDASHAGEDTSHARVDALRTQIELRAGELGVPPLRWPDPFPFDSTTAMRVATYAKSIGRGVAFAQAAFRQAFAGGHSLADEDYVLIAAAACEMHPAAVLKAAGQGRIAEQLQATTAAARELGVESVPAVRVGEQVLHGERALDRAAALAGARSGA